MTTPNQLKVALYVAIGLFLAGFISYAAFPPQKPPVPIRIMFGGAAGNVLFSHQIHASDTGYGISCYDCHHHFPVEDISEVSGCGACHLHPERDAPDDHTCYDCHEADEVEPEESPKRADAFHDQCIQCHQEYGGGPVECGDCHVL